jgi:hypothetical protein
MVQFIGLIVFTGQVTAFTGQVTAIVPNAPTAKAPGNVVDPHTAVIAFRSSDSPALTGLASTDLQPLANGWQGIKLSNADNIQFLSDTTNPRVQPLTQRVKGTDVSTIGLGSIPGRKLLSAYTAPYDGAAAVVGIPYGVLSTCKNAAPTPGVAPRIDTRLTLNVNAKLTVKVTSKSGITKSIVLAAGAPVVIANVPLSLMTDGLYTFNGQSHMKVYCAMVGSSVCTVGMGSAQYSCDPVSQTSASNSLIVSPGPLSQTGAIDFACSNTQWP